MITERRRYRFPPLRKVLNGPPNNERSNYDRGYLVAYLALFSTILTSLGTGFLIISVLFMTEALRQVQLAHKKT